MYLFCCKWPAFVNNKWKDIKLAIKFWYRTSYQKKKIERASRICPKFTKINILFQKKIKYAIKHEAMTKVVCLFILKISKPILLYTPHFIKIFKNMLYNIKTLGLASAYMLLIMMMIKLNSETKNVGIYRTFH